MNLKEAAKDYQISLRTKQSEKVLFQATLLKIYKLQEIRSLIIQITEYIKIIMLIRE